MLAKYPDKIKPLEQEAHGFFFGLPLLLFTNLAIVLLSLYSARLTWGKLILLAWGSSILSLWQLQILHDCLHGSLLPKQPFATEYVGKSSNTNEARLKAITMTCLNNLLHRRKNIESIILKFGSMPCAFGYHLYLKHGHLTHHKNLGDSSLVDLEKLFSSPKMDFEDGDVLFVAHRMKLLGNIGPKIQIFRRNITLSISRLGFDRWREGNAIWNASMFAVSFLSERFLLVLNELIVALSGRNYFFPNKPSAFHDACANYSRWALGVRLGLCTVAHSIRPLIFLILIETLWSIPPHPACAMFITNHGSSESSTSGGGCVPSKSTYSGLWYSILTLNTNYHMEHHDFPSIPLHKLHVLRHIAPEFYQNTNSDSVWSVMRDTFSKPEFYACMDATSMAKV